MLIKKATLLALPLFVAAIFISSETQLLSRITGGKTTVTLADSQQSTQALVYIAEKKGYLSDHGIELEYKRFEAGRNALKSVLDGEADMATVYETPVVLDSYKRNDIRIITTLHSSDKNTLLLIKKDRGIISIDDLVGARIALVKGTNAEYMLYSLIQSQNIDMNEIEIVDTPPEHLGETLDDESIDGIVAWNNRELFGIKESYKGGLLELYNPTYTEASMIVTTEDFIAENPQAVAGFVRGLSEAERFLEENKEEALALTAEHLGVENTEDIEQVWNNSSLGLGLNHMLLSLLEQEGMWYKQAGLAEGEVPNFRDLMAPRFLYDIRPEKVTLY